MFSKLIGANYLLSKPNHYIKKKDPLRYTLRSWLYQNRERVLSVFTMLYEDDGDVTKTGGLMSELVKAHKEIELLTTRNTALRRNNNIENSKMLQDLRQKIQDLEFRIEVLQQFRHTEFKSPTAEESERAGRDVEEAQKIISERKKEKEKER